MSIDKTQKDNNGKTILDYANKKWLNFLKKLPSNLSIKQAKINSKDVKKNDIFLQ